MGIFGAPKQLDFAAEQERAAAAERERIAKDNAISKANADAKATKRAAETESKRRAFSGQLATIGSENTGSQRYLQAV